MIRDARFDTDSRAKLHNNAIRRPKCNIIGNGWLYLTGILVCVGMWYWHA